MPRFKIHAEFYIQASDSELARKLAQDRLDDMVSEQYESAENVEVVCEVEYPSSHNIEDDEE